MKCLFLDLASHHGLIACVGDRLTLAHRHVMPRIPDDELLPMVDATLKDAHCTFADLTHLACIVGPGGFTSLRVAVALMNTFVWQLKIPVAGVHLSDLYRGRLAVSGKRLENVYWLHSTKKDQLFIRGGAWSEPTLITVEEFRTLAATRLQLPALSWMGELIPEHQTIVGCDPVPLRDVIEILPELLPSKNFSRETLMPWYGRGW